MQVPADIAVIHLVRAGNDDIAAARFITSYLAHPAGQEHTLVFLLKGFGGQLPGDLDALLNRVTHVRMECPEVGYDIGSYYHAAAALDEPMVLFLNSFSVIEGDQWLSKLIRAYREPGVGLVGASGSWESLVSTLLAAPCGSKTRIGEWLCRCRARLIAFALWPLFPPFPNPHLRSNGFLMARKDFLAIRPAPIRLKLQAWLFESGRSSMTRLILRRNLRVLVVGRDGSVYDIAGWPSSRTFWQYQQENLMIHDNRTMAYSRASEAAQAQLSRAAWNCRADSP